MPEINGNKITIKRTMEFTFKITIPEKNILKFAELLASELRNIDNMIKEFDPQT